MFSPLYYVVLCVVLKKKKQKQKKKTECFLLFQSARLVYLQEQVTRQFR